MAGLVSVFAVLDLGVLYWLADAQPESIDSTPPHACQRLRAASRTCGGGGGRMLVCSRPAGEGCIIGAEEA